MCMTCGCNRPNDDHDDPRNVTLNDLIEAAEAANITLADAIGNIGDTFEGVSDSSEQGRD